MMEYSKLSEALCNNS